MADKIDIYNLALGVLGMRGVTSLSEDVPSVDALNTFYQPSVNELFSEYPWSFATAKESLISVTDEVSELEWGYCYARPANAAGVWAVYNEATVTKKYEQEFEAAYQASLNRQILCTNLDSAYCEYTYIITDTKVFSPKFIMALAHKLAAHIAQELIADSKKRDGLINMALTFIEETKRTNHAEKRKRNVLTSTYRSAR